MVETYSLSKKQLESLTNLVTLVERFNQMQKYDISKADTSIREFEIVSWRRNWEGLRTNIEGLAKFCPIAKEYLNGINVIFDNQRKYREETKLPCKMP